jgi:hypothetical protein
LSFPSLSSHRLICLSILARLSRVTANVREKPPTVQLRGTIASAECNRE